MTDQLPQATIQQATPTVFNAPPTSHAMPTAVQLDALSEVVIGNAGLTGETDVEKALRSMQERGLVELPQDLTEQ